MKKLLTFFVMLAGISTCYGQTVIDNFNVGPYNVDYTNQGEVKYRLRDNIDLYEFFELKKDTTIVVLEQEIPIEHAIGIAGNIGTNHYSAKEVGVEGVWKQLVAKNLYANGGLLLNFSFDNFGKHSDRSMLEVGIPLQIEWGKMNHQKGTLYGSFGIAPTFYATLKAENQNAPKDVDVKKSGFMIAPSLEFGGNIPVGPIIMRIGVYGKVKINCTPGDFNVYTQGKAGRIMIGAKIGVVL